MVLANNMRAKCFGSDGDTRWKRKELEAACAIYRHFALDIRDHKAVKQAVGELVPDLIIHAAASGKRFTIYGYKGKII